MLWQTRTILGRPSQKPHVRLASEHSHFPTSSPLVRASSSLFNLSRIFQLPHDRRWKAMPCQYPKSSRVTVAEEIRRTNPNKFPPPRSLNHKITKSDPNDILQIQTILRNSTAISSHIDKLMAGYLFNKITSQTGR